MPYRNLMITMAICAAGISAVALYLRANSRYLTTTVGEVTTRNHNVEMLTKGTILLALILLGLLFVIGTMSIIKTILRLDAGARKRQRTRYVDAWKIAGERMDPPKEK